MPSLNEHQIIKLFASALKLGELDDIAIVTVNGTTTVAFKCDMLVESTDVPPGMKPWQVARKSIVSCASDFASKGIKPIAAMIAIGLPRGVDKKYVSGLAKGFAIASRQLGVKIVGGDTNESDELTIDCSMIGAAPPLTPRAIKMPKRGGAKVGDAVVTSGPFGLPPSGLKILLQKAKATASFRKKAVASVMNPEPAQKFGSLLAKYFNASMDSSDGLALSLYTIASESKVNIALDDLPIAKGLREFADTNGIDEDHLVLYGGEEYHIVATLPSKNLSRVQRIAKSNSLDLRVLGKVIPGNGKVYLKGELVLNKGYTHFKPNPLPR
jgi:thiamine-monophosphate kinase